jgi:predicted kinase
MSDKHPTVYMLVGLPASGKSTYYNTHFKNLTLVSTDAHIEKHAALVGKTYGEVFKDKIAEAEALMNKNIKTLVAEKKSFVWDQTNMNVKNRARKLAMIPKDYDKVAIAFEIPESVREQRDKLRVQKDGKFIPKHIIDSMRKSYERPTVEEGFTSVKIVKG